eukprot:10613431-Lingulodinium_polyedra.AAC.1
MVAPPRMPSGYGIAHVPVRAPAFSARHGPCLGASHVPTDGRERGDRAAARAPRQPQAPAGSEEPSRRPARPM